MRKQIAKSLLFIALIALLVSVFALPASAMDEAYRIEDFGITMKLPKSYLVITRDTPRDDEVFSELNLDYDETMTAFSNANIYVRAYEPEQVFQISLTVTEDENSRSVNNYSDLTAAERKAILDVISGTDGVKSAVEVKHNGNIYFDSESVSTQGDTPVYINHSNTVVNGLLIDLTLMKTEEPIEPDEAKALTNAANSVSFDNIKRDTGPIFDWWRLLLWIGVLAAMSIAVSIIYKQHNAADARKRAARRDRRHQSGAETTEEIAGKHTAGEMTFEQSLGYTDDEEFNARSEADEMAGYDISVREKDPAKGVVFFEDEGDSIDDGTDYFDTYFKEPTEKRTPLQRFFSAIGAYLLIAINHTGYFFKNLFNRLFGRNKKQPKE